MADGRRARARGRRQPRERFYQFQWRPRAPSLLSREAEADLLKRLKEFSKRYDEEDNALLDEVGSAIIAHKIIACAQTMWPTWADCAVAAAGGTQRGHAAACTALRMVRRQRRRACGRCSGPAPALLLRSHCSSVASSTAFGGGSHTCLAVSFRALTPPASPPKR